MFSGNCLIELSNANISAIVHNIPTQILKISFKLFGTTNLIEQIETIIDNHKNINTHILRNHMVGNI